MTATTTRRPTTPREATPARATSWAENPRPDYRELELLARRGWRIEIVRGDQLLVRAISGTVTLTAHGATVGEATDALLAQLRRPPAARRARRAAPAPDGDAESAGRDATEEESPRGPSLRHELCVLGLPAREASRLRDAFARARVPIDDDVDDGVVLVRRTSSQVANPEQVLAVLREWARGSGITRLPVVYGGNAYVLGVESHRSAGGPTDRPLPAQSTT